MDTTTRTLTKDWGPYKAGETIEVDYLRAQTLDEEGYTTPIEAIDIGLDSLDSQEY